MTGSYLSLFFLAIIAGVTLAMVFAIKRILLLEQRILSLEEKIEKLLEKQ